ncbi:MAG: prepilin peptidase [Acidobacteria bacterium]|nr:prepilin peptidase [Acidobacteriota bacterium]
MMEPFLAALFGLLIGSFLNVCIFRMPRDLSVVQPRSFCPACEKPVAWYDNIPLLSFMLLRGRCRQCRERIGWRYPVVELLTAVCFFLAIRHYGLTAAGFKFSAFAAMLIGLTFSDFEERILPDEFTLGGAVLGLAFAYLSPIPPGLTFFLLPMGTDPRWFSMGESLIGGLICGGTIWLVGAAYQKIRHREGLGFGDVKMIAMIGAFLGLHGALLTLIVGSVLGAVLGLLFIVLARKDAASYELPFGSFLGIAALVVTLVASPLVEWYRQLG